MRLNSWTLQSGIEQLCSIHRNRREQEAIGKEQTDRTNAKRRKKELETRGVEINRERKEGICKNRNERDERKAVIINLKRRQIAAWFNHQNM
jgi:hypothetical protein